MCGKTISQGIVCEACDKPRKPRKPATEAKPAAEASPAPQTPPAAEPPAVQTQAKTPPVAPPPQSQPRQSAQSSGGSAAPAAARAVDPFPKAPVLPFPVEATSIAMTSICDVLTAARVPSLLVTFDRAVKFCSSDARVLLGLNESAHLPSLAEIESRIGATITDLRQPSSMDVKLGDQPAKFSVVPLSGGSSGAVLVIRPFENNSAVHASFMSYIREAVLMPLRGLRESLIAAATNRKGDPLLHDAAATIDQILSSIEMAPGVEEGPESATAESPTATSVVRRVADRFTTVADRKNVSLTVDVHDVPGLFRNHHELEQVLVILMENSLHYVPTGGQIVLGLRSLEHKGKPLLLFFVMDNGPLVPDDMREKIFTDGYSWQANSEVRGGRGLTRCRDFANAHGGSVWVESKTGKACTFFLRVRPDA
jgi:hypothetical protein